MVSHRLIPNGNTTHSDACRARVEALMAADPELREMLESAQKRNDEYMAKMAEPGAEPSRRDRGTEPSEEPRAPSPLDATAAAGSPAVLAECEARGFSLTLRGGGQQNTKRGDIAFLLVKFICADSLHMGCLHFCPTACDLAVGLV